MSQSEILSLQHLQSEVVHLKDELQTRDQLVQQLSQELFRLVKQSNKTATATGNSTDRDLTEMRALRNQLKVWKNK